MSVILTEAIILAIASVTVRLMTEFQATGRIPPEAEVKAMVKQVLAAHANLDDALNGEAPAQPPTPA